MIVPVAAVKFFLRLLASLLMGWLACVLVSMHLQSAVSQLLLTTCRGKQQREWRQQGSGGQRVKQWLQCSGTSTGPLGNQAHVWSRRHPRH